jgi:hypothetical protein
VGGAIMMVEQSLVLVIAFAVLFVRMLGQSEEEERRRERLEDAAEAKRLEEAGEAQRVEDPATA